MDAKSPSPASENLQLGYQSAIALWVYEGNLIWAKYNTMLVANSIVLAVVGLSLGSETLPALFSQLLPVAGIFLCLLWWQLTKRGFDQYRYWILCTREIEEKFNGEIDIASRGGRFASGQTVTFSIDGGTVTHKLSRGATGIRAAQNAYIGIAVFALLYVLLLF